MTLVADSPSSESPRQYFRRHLRQHVSASELVWYLDQSMPRFAGSAEVRLAVEELVDRLGEFVGFGVGRDAVDEYSTWTSPQGPRLLVWVESSARAIGRMASCLHSRTQRLGTLDVEREDDLTCLYVLAGAFDERLVNEAVALRRASRQVRLISTRALLALAHRVEHGRFGHADALAVLRPPSALADGLVALLPDEQR